jgi:hypothetical protein
MRGNREPHLRELAADGGDVRVGLVVIWILERFVVGRRLRTSEPRFEARALLPKYAERRVVTRRRCRPRLLCARLGRRALGSRRKIRMEGHEIGELARSLLEVGTSLFLVMLRGVTSEVLEHGVEQHFAPVLRPFRPATFERDAERSLRPERYLEGAPRALECSRRILAGERMACELFEATGFSDGGSNLLGERSGIEGRRRRY